MNDPKKIEEVIEAKMTEIEAYNNIKQSDSYFMLERFLKRYAWKCWRRGVDSYNEMKKQSVAASRQ